ncbi:MAG: alpha-L-fucosidase [Clostridium sp.]|nr:alpha-L-fucosidase [Clostridium sp.]
MNLKTLILSASLLAVTAAASAAEKPFVETPEQKAERMKWFGDAKLGIFIHWGPYSKGETSESWAFHNGYISIEDYMKQADAFTAANYDPEYWAKLIKESGAKYTVITTKHHDGFALWDTKAGDVSAVKSSPARRDVIDPFAKAVRDQGLKLGFYFSLIDWPRQDYPETYRDKPPKYDIKAEPERWQHFLDFNNAQLTELSTTWNPDLYWFDGDWEHSSEEWKAPEIIAMLHRYNPGVIVNSRIQGNGDYETPELGVPVARPEAKWWETCMTSNDSWGYRIADTNFKSSKTIIKMLADCINLGGNLLLDIGPKADGTIPEEQVQILKDLGRWTSKHAEAIYGTRAGIPAGHVQAYTSLNPTGDILYLFVPYTPNEAIEIKGLKSYIKKARVVGTDRELDWKLYNDVSWGTASGVYYLNVPAEVCDPDMTVIALELEEPIKLYNGPGQVQTFNDMDAPAALAK